MDNILEVVELKGYEPTWIGGVKESVYRGRGLGFDTVVHYTRCISKQDAENLETKKVTLKETNGCYPIRYWTNLPEYWDNHAVICEPQTTLIAYECSNELFQDYTVIREWLADEAAGRYDDGYTEYAPGEFEEKCQHDVELYMAYVTELPINAEYTLQYSQLDENGYGGLEYYDTEDEFHNLTEAFTRGRRLGRGSDPSYADVKLLDSDGDEVHDFE